MAYVNDNGAAPIFEGSVSVAPANTSVNQILSNAAASGRRLKVTSLLAANVDGSNSVNASLAGYSAASLGGSAAPLASTISVPANASLILIDESTPIVLGADSSLGVTSGVANKLVFTCTYQIFLGT